MLHSASFHQLGSALFAINTKLIFRERNTIILEIITCGSQVIIQYIQLIDTPDFIVHVYEALWKLPLIWRGLNILFSQSCRCFLETVADGRKYWIERISCGIFHNFLLDLIVLLRLPLTVLIPEWSKSFTIWLFWIENQDNYAICGHNNYNIWVRAWQNQQFYFTPSEDLEQPGLRLYNFCDMLNLTSQMRYLSCL